MTCMAAHARCSTLLATCMHGLGIYMHTWIDYLMQCSPQPKLKARIRKVQINVNNSKYRVYNTIETGEYPTPYATMQTHCG